MTREWSWLKGGIALGLLSAFAFITYSPLGVSTSYPRTVALILQSFAPEFVAENAYFQRVPPVVDWQLMLVLGIVLGGFLASRVVGRAQASSCGAPATQLARGSSTSAGKSSVTEGSGAGTTGVFLDTAPVPSRRKWLSFAGGFLVLFGARLAGGCTSGHVITGFTQLATASFLFAGAVFAVGIPVAMFMKRRGLT